MSSDTTWSAPWLSTRRRSSAAPRKEEVPVIAMRPIAA
jgi:hypothetical protein